MKSERESVYRQAINEAAERVFAEKGAAMQEFLECIRCRGRQPHEAVLDRLEDQFLRAFCRPDA
jgi:hypothetical protein